MLEVLCGSDSHDTGPIVLPIQRFVLDGGENLHAPICRDDWDLPGLKKIGSSRTVDGGEKLMAVWCPSVENGVLVRCLNICNGLLIVRATSYWLREDFISWSLSLVQNAAAIWS